MRKNSIKNTRINSEVQRALSTIIREEVKDPRVDPLLSVTDVVVAPDLKTAKAYISVLGDAEKLSATIEGLKKAEGYIRSCLAKSVNLRNTPQITFIPDTSIAYGVAMTKRIDEVAAAIPDRPKEDADEEA
ncbi:MAG: 30S ribosome-binding factor RbfA [Lachnospiraceae bacterium]|nr:30S ribosome-binding factor RbfA [Lachnospiraceae bacterium]